MKLCAFFPFGGRPFDILNTGIGLFYTELQGVLLHFLVEKRVINTVKGNSSKLENWISGQN